jgi:hypothetical protein
MTHPNGVTLMGQQPYDSLNGPDYYGACPKKSFERVRLRKAGEHIMVDIDVDGSWIEVIRERADSEFDHIVSKRL